MGHKKKKKVGVALSQSRQHYYLKKGKYRSPIVKMVSASRTGVSCSLSEKAAPGVADRHTDESEDSIVIIDSDDRSVGVDGNCNQ